MTELLIKNVFLSKELKHDVISLCDYAIKSQRYNKTTNTALINLKDRLLSKANVITSYEKDLINLIYRIKTSKEINKNFNRINKIKKEINIRNKKQGKLNFINSILNNYISKVFSLLLLTIFSIVD